MPKNPLKLPKNPVELLENPVELPQNPVQLPKNPVELPKNPVEFHFQTSFWDFNNLIFRSNYKSPDVSKCVQYRFERERERAERIVWAVY